MHARPSLSVQRTEGAAATALGERWVRRIARIGILSRAVNYLVLAVLVALILLGRGDHEVDRRGAVQAIAAEPFGQFLLVLLGAGLIALVVWQILRALTRRADQGSVANLGRRLAAAATAVIYAAFLVSTVLVLRGAQPSSPQAGQQALTARLLADNGGRLLVAVGGAAFIAVGLCLLGFAATRRFEAALDTGRMGPVMRPVAATLGVVGQSARALVFVIIGGFVVSAAVSRNAAQSKGLDESLHTLAAQHFGAIMLGVVALGFLAYSLFSLVDAAYREDFSR